MTVLNKLIITLNHNDYCFIYLHFYIDNVVDEVVNEWLFR